MIKARPNYSTDLYGTIYIDNIQKTVVICLIIPTIFPFDAISSIKNTRMYDVSTLDPASKGNVVGMIRQMDSCFHTYRYLLSWFDETNEKHKNWVRVMVFNDTFNNISIILWWLVLLVEETGHFLIAEGGALSEVGYCINYEEKV